MKKSVQMIGVPKAQTRENNEEGMFKEIKRESCPSTGGSFQMEKAHRAPAHPRFRSPAPGCAIRESESMREKRRPYKLGVVCVCRGGYDALEGLRMRMAIGERTSGHGFFAMGSEGCREKSLGETSFLGHEAESMWGRGATFSFLFRHRSEL